MKRIVYVAGGLAALVVLWSAGWHGLRIAVIEPEADRAVERMREGAFFLSYDRREVGGFPFGYDLTYRNVRVAGENGAWNWTAPWSRISREDGEVVARSAPESRLEVTGADGSTLVFAIASDGLTTYMAGEGGLATGRTEARTLSVALVEGVPILPEGAAAFTGMTLDVSTSDGAYSGELSADTANLTYRLSPDGVTESRSETRMDRLSMDFALDLRNAGSLPELLEADGSVSVSYYAAGFEGASESTGGPSAPPMKLTFRGGEANAEFELADGRVTYAAATRGLSWATAFAEPGPFPNGGMRAAGMSVSMSAPMLKTGEAAPYDIEMMVEALELDPEIWTAFDPAGALDHAPIALEIRLGGDARVLSDFREAMSAQPPVDLETLDISAFTVSALGARMEATGALEIAGDARRPDGTITLRTFGAMKLVDDLTRAGLAPPEAGGFYKDLAAQLTRPGEADGELVSEITAKDGLISVNGQLIAQ